MRLPGIKAFKKQMAGRPGFVILLSDPKGENLHDMILQGPLSDEQFERLSKFVLAIMKEKREMSDGGG